AVTFAIAAALGCDRAPQIDNSRHAPAIERLVSSSPAWVDRDKLGSTLWKVERDFYESRTHLPAWMEGDQASPRVAALVEALKHSEDQGLDPARYNTDGFQQAIAAAAQNKGTYDLARIPELDAKLTYAYLRYAADLLGWSGNPKAVYATWMVVPNEIDLADHLAKAVSSDHVRESLDELAPGHPQYKGRQTALQHERMNPTGHLDQIRMNMERWRWTPRDLGERYIFVNVPAYQMQVMEGNRAVLAMRVIVGDPKHTTPLFSDE